MNTINQRQNVEDSKRVLEEVNRRHDDIKQIERTIAELVELFEEMKLQVELQDYIIVKIANEVEMVENDAKDATVELKHAENIIEQLTERRCKNIFYFEVEIYE
ncbi:15748_t:CDS:2 [Funneliformis mosseae]|uniref:15748_t:CDS:1 n=1 Tax=Funneliformis mosseae TaxID=27381 RepID=A0A9N9BH58_FUNMO|nr:15748_t:CDS:2 [Funneliformis mosseae]